MCYHQKRGIIELEVTIREYNDNPIPEIEIIVDNTSIRVYTNSIEKALEQAKVEIMKRVKNAISLY